MSFREFLEDTGDAFAGGGTADYSNVYWCKDKNKCPQSKYVASDGPKPKKKSPFNIP